MANKKSSRNSKSYAAQTPTDAGSIWLAGVGAVSLARKQGGVLLGELAKEGRRLHGEATRFVRETRADAQVQVEGVLTPVKARLESGAKRAAATVQTGVAGVLARLGIPSKANIEELSQRVGTLSRQLKASPRR
ncbi:MAG TPA: phasin family protein [Rudaea sp.]|jgi:poly(hydroxyalkanoate) granule-associated protein